MAKELAGIEYFLWSKDGKQSDKLIYYDKEGNYIEKPIPKGLLDEPLKFFDGKPKAVNRTSGGLSLAEPHQIVVYQGNEIRIRVRIKELVRSQQGYVISPKPVYQMKVVPLSQMEPGFEIHAGEKQSYAVDLGQGLLPIHVFHIETDIQGQKHALFVLEPQLKKALATPGTEKAALETYRLPAEILRWARPEVARESQKNVEKLVAEHSLYIPESLQATSPITIAGGTSLEMLRHFLRLSANPNDKQWIEPLLIRVEKKEELLPFGLFEAP